METTPSADQLAHALSQLEDAAAAGRLSAGAVANLRPWLTEPRYREYLPLVVQHLAAGRWQQLDDAYWTVIPFGTGGRRGRMYPIGSNTINDRTIGESAQGLADYVRRQEGWRPLACAIAYDTRHQSRHFAELCAEIMVANGFRVFFLDGFRSTPELSFAVRFQDCACGIMVSASHNPPSDNAVKVYGPTGGQLLPPHDQGVIDCVMRVDAIQRRPWQEAVAAGQIILCQSEVDRAYLDAVSKQGRPGRRDLKILYSPLHGVGTSAVCPALAAAGFQHVEVFGPHAAPDPDFSNVPGHVSNPENPAVFESPIARAVETAAELVLATDPDCDRLGAAAPQTLAPAAPWATLTGNQVGALLTAYLLQRRRDEGSLRPQHYVVKTLVTTEMIRRIADTFGVRTVGDLLVGFKYIGGAIEELGEDGFVLGAEESYGFLIGSHARDKDGAVAALVLAELAADAKGAGLSLHQKLDELFLRHGCHQERQFSATMPGSSGMERMRALMARFRQNPPIELAGLRVARIHDYLRSETHGPEGRIPLPGPVGDLIFLDLAVEGNYVAVRPSGTEPKVKFYLFAYCPAAEIMDLATVKADLARRLELVERDLRAYAAL